ncbi:MAG: hypothetical protein WCP57_04715 [Bacteroidota bacterium]
MTAQLFSGNVNSSTKKLDHVIIDVFDYSQNVKNFYTDSIGRFSFPLDKNKEYIVSFSKNGYKTQVFSILMSQNFTTNINLEIDADQPNGLLSTAIQYRVQYALVEQKPIKTLFDYDKINSLKKADSIKVIFNKLQVNQYRYFSDYLYDQEKNEIQHLTPTQIEIQKEETITSLENIKEQLKQNIIQITELTNAEKNSIEISKKTEAKEQLKQLVNAQENLYKRIYEIGQQYLLEKSENLLLYKLKMFDYYNDLKAENNALDFETKTYFKKSRLNAQAAALNYLYMANFNYSKYENHLLYYQNAYQEYIELLKYYNSQVDSNKLNPVVYQTKVSSFEPIHFPKIEAKDTLMNMEDKNREAIIENALIEEERFKNYSKTESTVFVDGEEVKRISIKVADDIYEQTTTKNGIIKYYKNHKPISATTYTFETTRKYKNILDSVK